ncbi:MAG: methyl-accepting chemotaxis protein, partial [Spirochaetes bacterium]|nr:methyl-accepting chemotaxis protein [Spirochaetota bacterium]
MKLSNKIVASVGALVLVTSGVLGTVAVGIGSASVHEQVMAHLRTQADMGAKFVGKALASDLAILQELADRARTRSMDWSIQRDSLSPDVERHGYLDIGVVGLDGTARYVLDGSEAQLADRGYVQS